MDNRLKERLVGAVVLVLAAIIFIPMVLDGPGMDRKVSQRVPLPDGNGDDGLRTERIDLAAPPAGQFPEPVSVDLTPTQTAQPASTSPQTAEPVTRETADTAAKTERPDESPAEQPTEPAAPWTVQAGSFSQSDNAEALAERIRQLGHAAYVQRHVDGGRTFYRVRVGGYPDRETAQRAAAEIGAQIGLAARATPAG